MQGINCVKGEIHNVLSALRLSSRERRTSYYLSHSGATDEPLLRRLKTLHDSLNHLPWLGLADTCAVLDPFLSVIASEHTDPGVTLTALESVHKFLVYNHITVDSPYVDEAMSSLAECLTQRRFAPTSRDESEAVYMKSLEVLLECLRSPAGHLLSNDAVCGMVEECYNIRALSGASQLLQRYAENLASQMVLVIFARLSPDTPTGGAAIAPLVTPVGSRDPSGSKRLGLTAKDTEEKGGSFRGAVVAMPSPASKSPMTATVNRGPIRTGHSLRRSTSTGSNVRSGSISPLIIGQGTPPVLSPPPSPSPMAAWSPGGGLPLELMHTPFARLPRRASTTGQELKKAGKSKKPLVPYGLPALVRIFSFLANTINPRHSVNNRVLGLRLLRIVFETAGSNIGNFEALVQIIQNDLCKHLLQNTQTKELSILSLALRIVFDLFNSVKEHLKVQLEVFFSSIHLRIGESDSSTFEQKELVMESLVEFCNEPSLIVGLYRNYDCEVGSTNLFEDLCKFLAEGSLVSLRGQAPSTLQVLCLEGILAVLNSVARRFCDPDDISAQEETQPRNKAGMTPEEKKILQSRQRKQKLKLAAEHFNRDGHKSFKFLQTLKILSDPLQADSIVQFFKETPHLDKTKMGEVLGGSKPLNVAVLKAYVQSFDFSKLTDIPVRKPSTRQDVDNRDEDDKGKHHEVDSHDAVPDVRLDEALRVFLESFRLPGESQQIERIMECFSERFFKYYPGPLASSSAAYVLAYSVIMLNTDAHNPQIKAENRMTLAHWLNNNKGINDGKNIPRSYLVDIYESITKHEIRMKDSSFRLGDEDGDGVSDHKWDSLVRRSQTTGPFLSDAPRFQGKDMFSLVWDSGLHVFQHYMLHGLGSARQDSDEMEELCMMADTRMSEDPDSLGSLARGEMRTSAVEELRVLHKIINGFYTFSRICAYYGLNEIFNKMVIALCKSLNGYFMDLHRVVTTELGGASDQDKVRAAAQQMYGFNQRAQQVTLLLFDLVLTYGESHILEGWTNVLQTVLWMRTLGFLEGSVLEEMDDFSDEQGRPLFSLGSRPSSDVASVDDAGVGSFLSSALGFLFHETKEHETSVERSSELRRDRLSGTASSPLAMEFGRTPRSSKPALQVEIPATGGLALRHAWAGSAKSALDRCRLPELFSSTKFFRPQVLGHLVQALVLVSTFASSTNRKSKKAPVAIEQFDAELLKPASAVFCLERLCDVVERNQGRMQHLNDQETKTVEDRRQDVQIWPAVQHHLSNAIAKSPVEPTFYVERVVVNVLRFAIRLKPSRSSTQRLLKLLEPICQVSTPTLKVIGERVAAGLKIFVRTRGDLITAPREWQALFGVLLKLRILPQTAKLSFDVVRFVVDNAVSARIYPQCVDVLLAFARLPPEAPPQQWSPIQPQHVLTGLGNLHRQLADVRPKLPDAQKEKEYHELWLVSLQAMCRLCMDERPEVQVKALSTLQGAVLTSGVEIKSPMAWRTCYDSLFIPLLGQLSTRAFSSAAQHVHAVAPDIVMKCGTIMFQSFLHNVNAICAAPEFHLFWLKFLGAFEMYLQGDTGNEKTPKLALTSTHFTESLKNLLLVLDATKAFASISKRTGQDVWALTWTVLERVRPALREEFGAALESQRAVQRGELQGAGV